MHCQNAQQARLRPNTGSTQAACHVQPATPHLPFLSVAVPSPHSYLLANTLHTASGPTRGHGWLGYSACGRPPQGHLTGIVHPSYTLQPHPQAFWPCSHAGPCSLSRYTHTHTHTHVHTQLDERLTTYIGLVAAILDKEADMEPEESEGVHGQAHVGGVRRMSTTTAKEIISTVVQSGPTLLSNLSGTTTQPAPPPPCLSTKHSPPARPPLLAFALYQTPAYSAPPAWLGHCRQLGRPEVHYVHAGRQG